VTKRWSTPLLWRRPIAGRRGSSISLERAMRPFPRLNAGLPTFVTTRRTAGSGIYPLAPSLPRGATITPLAASVASFPQATLLFPVGCARRDFCWCERTLLADRWESTLVWCGDWKTGLLEEPPGQPVGETDYVAVAAAPALDWA